MTAKRSNRLLGRSRSERPESAHCSRWPQGLPLGRVRRRRPEPRQPQLPHSRYCG